MSRRGNIAKRDVLADPIYNSKMVTRLVNSVMLDGKKGVAQKIVYEAFSMIQEKTGNDPLETFEKAMENIMPSLECKTRRVGGANYQVPLEVSPARRETLGLRWLTAYSRSRGEKTMAQRLAAEIMDAANNTGNAVKKREDTHKMAEANEAFSMIQEKTGNDPLETFEKAMENIMPSLECKTRRVGGANYQVPLEVSPARRETLGLRWLTAYSRSRGEKTMAQRLAAEIMDAANNTGNAVKKREDTHKMAEANKAFAHFRY